MPDGVVGVTRGSGGPETVAIVPVVVAVVEVERVQPHLKEIQFYWRSTLSCCLFQSLNFLSEFCTSLHFLS